LEPGTRVLAHRGLSMVGVRGLEPPTSASQTPRATNCATPRCSRPPQIYAVGGVASSAATTILIYDRPYDAIGLAPCAVGMAALIPV